MGTGTFQVDGMGAKMREAGGKGPAVGIWEVCAVRKTIAISCEPTALAIIMQVRGRTGLIPQGTARNAVGSAISLTLIRTDDESRQKRLLTERE
jgi:hypothetical protein